MGVSFVHSFLFTCKSHILAFKVDIIVTALWKFRLCGTFLASFY